MAICVVRRIMAKLLCRAGSNRAGFRAGRLGFGGPFCNFRLPSDVASSNAGVTPINAAGTCDVDPNGCWKRFVTALNRRNLLQCPVRLPETPMRLVRMFVVAMFALCAATAAGAADLVIGLATDVTSLDPHYHNLTPNNNIAQHVYGFLVQRNEKEQLDPGLATQWKSVDPTTWEFALRRGVKFDDGSDVTAADVVASINRVSKVPNSPSPFTAYTKQITRIEVVDPYTVRFHTATPYPLMPSDLTQVTIISKAVESASTDDFNSGKAAIGTGPYKLVRFAKGDRIELVRFDGWWGGKT